MARLTLVSVDDSSPQPLSEKLLTRPRMLAKIAAMIPNRQRCHLIPYNTTGLERDIALTLGIPMYGSDPQLADLGTRLAAGDCSLGRGAASARCRRTSTASRRSPTRSSRCFRSGRA
jgi:hypothetical protein